MRIASKNCSVVIHVARADEDCQILGHLTRLNRLDSDPLERFGEVDDIRSVVELAAILEPAGPGEVEAIGLVEVALPSWCMR